MFKHLENCSPENEGGGSTHPDPTQARLLEEASQHTLFIFQQVVTKLLLLLVLILLLNLYVLGNR